MCAKSLQQRLEEARAASPARHMTPGQQAHQVINAAKKGVPTGKVTKGAFKPGHTGWATGRFGDQATWGKTRKQRGEELRATDPEKFKQYFGYKENHTEETIAQMEISATNRWKDPEERLAQSRRLKGIPKPKITCEYCGRAMSAPNLKRHGHTEGKCIK